MMQTTAGTAEAADSSQQSADSEEQALQEHRRRFMEGLISVAPDLALQLFPVTTVERLFHGLRCPYCGEIHD